jgi:putative ABC transport system permease protein
MSVKADFKEAINSLWYSKQRTLLAIVGITIGIGSVIGMVSIGKIIQEEAMKQFLAMGTDRLTLTRFSQNSKAENRILLQDTIDLKKTIDDIKELAPHINGSGEPTYRGKKFERASIYGVTQSFAPINDFKIAEGRFLSDLDRLSFYAVVGYDIAEVMRQNGGADSLIGEQLKIGDRLFTVIGVLEKSTNQNLDVEPNDAVLTHLTTQARLDKNLEIQNVRIRVGPKTKHDEAIAQIKSYLMSKKGIEDLEIRSPEDLIKQMDEQMEMFTLLLGAIGSISLIVGGVGVMNVMLVSVTERKKEIGVRRALGARRRNIKMQFLIESTTLSMLGGLVGIALGIAVAYFVADYGEWEFVISEMAIAVGFGVSSVVGMFFGFYPASQAAKLDPIQALKSD